MNFGERLYKLRKEKNLSQEELAELLDVSRQSISKWENDKAYPEMTRLLFMSDYFGVTLDYLMRGVECNEKPQESAQTETQKEYKTKNLLTIWNTFVSNLSGRQRKLMLLLYFLIVALCVAVIFAFLYHFGYVIGKTLAHITN
ncbi:MAG: helix-turn-helix domain-containing protein [Acutalibacteraceae bacterium]|nr:helix-turn-helix domain-containing protein [Acutalibacteraceae bacterium]